MHEVIHERYKKIEMENNITFILQEKRRNFDYYKAEIMTLLASIAKRTNRRSREIFKKSMI